MAKFSGRSGSMLFFTDGDRGVIVDSEYGVVVASGRRDLLSDSGTWGAGEFSETDAELAQSALSVLNSTVSVPTGRMYTVPKGVQQEAKRALSWMNTHERGGTDVSVVTASVLSQGGQISFEKLRHVNRYLSRHANDKFADTWEPAKDGGPSASRINWGMWGGDTAQKWTDSIISREGDKALTADGIYVPSATDPDTLRDPFQEAFDLEEGAPEFLARVRRDGSGIDRLYKIDSDGKVYVWDDGIWDNMGLVGGDIYAYDAALDMPDGDLVDEVGKTHIVIDPSSAVIIGARLQNDPFKFISIDDIDADEAELTRDAYYDDEEDWSYYDHALVAAVDMTPGVDTPEERSARASTQVRDGDGKFATSGQRVMVGGNPTQTGTITQVNGADGTVNVQLEAGGTVTVPGKSVNGVDAFTQTIPGKPVSIPRVDLTGILAEPRTPINVKGPQIPGTLPAMTTRDLHDLLYNWPAWVKGQRDAFIPQARTVDVPVGSSSRDDIRSAEKKTGSKFYMNVYEHPLLKKWLNKTNRDGSRPNAMWDDREFSITAAIDNGAAMSPESSDVQPIYLASVAADDPTAVLELIALVPASTTQTSPMTYTRKKGDWERNPRTLADLQSATPPPVVPLDSAALEDCLDQMDGQQEQDVADEQPAPQTVQVSDIQVSSQAPAAPVTASITTDQALMILWGPNPDAIIAAGGADRNRGGAEKLRKYWTSGPGAAKIMWGTPGDWTRCVRHLGKYMGTRAKGYCALRHKEKTGMWTGDKGNLSVVPGEFNNVEVATEEEFLTNATLNARADTLRAKMAPQGLTAAAALELELNPDFKYHYGPIHQTPSLGIKGKKFRIPLVLPVGLETGDGRIVDPEAQVDLRNLPLPLLWQFKTASGHDGSVVVGRIDRMEVTKSGVRNAVGYFDTGAWGAEAERMVSNGFLYGVSADMDKFEAQEVPVFAEKENEDDDDKVEKSQVVINKTRVMAVTIVAKPAFQECQILIDEDDSNLEEESLMIPDGIYVDDVDPIEAAALVAAGYVAEHIPVAPPRDWFDNPRLHGPTPITVTDDGRVFGHIAAWNTDHVGMANNIKPPRSRSNYAYFKSGVLRTQEGEDVEVGQLTLAGGHAGLEFSAREAVKHYDDTASAIADVNAGEDEFGIWVSGGLRPGTTPQQVRVFRASAPSGDWRPIKGRLELVAVCQVNVPGFPVARSLVAGGQTMALVAAGAATIAHLQSDPISEMTARLEKLEQFTTTELSSKVNPIREKFAKIRAEKDAAEKAELSAKAEALTARFASFSTKRTTPEAKSATLSEFSTTSASMRSRLAEFAAPTGSKQEDEERQRDAERLARSVDPTEVEAEGKTAQGTKTAQEETRPKYNPETQPRNSDGKYRLILARLRENVGVNGNQAIVEKIKEAQALASGRDYKKASVAYADLVNTIDRIDTKSLDANTLGAMKQASGDLAEVVANLPLPFDDQSQKIRFSDLPPVLREMTQNLVAKVRTEYGEEANEKLSEILRFMSGGDYYSQSDVSSELNTLVHLLTKK
jgi:hypothetical protein